MNPITSVPELKDFLIEIKSDLIFFFFSFLFVCVCVGILSLFTNM